MLKHQKSKNEVNDFISQSASGWDNYAFCSRGWCVSLGIFCLVPD